ncbi:Capsular polysaccharide type 8 biosynthesis protein cap8A [Anaerococcus prevotii]|uniref:Lipopolysaccharide biosynthesis protein n=1 Tax=Anaerococcus prevotii (strain ATCC 9321 / DSM 20548 / JCM 6508 / NCTC 11806 / PC1) TaxID=525919 RepID=C7RGH5_ANAPD|nr:Wzz/FepE/Etk N-terminal domain-containing protein [Anaerococcus prevotii]ACV28586.1 lipopolysaccharide biosynthesis protein [Anaerococcus prevotii DSM 20548]SUU94145.1 Capsular polysaccharide type 8 biosynthesis protein cap8A [Anaerococcus prevotii]
MNEQEIDLIELSKKIGKHLPMIIIFSIIVGAASFLLSKFVITPKYDSNTTMIVSNSNQNNDPNNPQTNVELGQIQANKALISTYSEIVKSKGIAERVINNLGLDMDYEEFSSKVSIEPVKDTQIISVKVVDTIPERAMDIANETANIFKSSIGEIMNVDNVQILDGAILPEEASSPNIKKNTAIGIILGFVLGVAVVLFKEIADSSVKSSEEVTEYFDIPVIGIVPDSEQGN